MLTDGRNLTGLGRPSMLGTLRIPKKWPTSVPHRPHIFRRIAYGPTLEDRFTPREAAIFALLLKRRGEWMHVERIISAVWDDSDDPPLARTLSVHIARIRKKLIGTSFQVQSKWGFGYRISKLIGLAND